MSAKTDADKTDAKTNDGGFNRRSILLGGTTLAAASALTAGTTVKVTKGQAQPAQSSPISTRSSPVRRAAPRSSPDRVASARAC